MHRTCMSGQHTCIKFPSTRTIYPHIPRPRCRTCLTQGTEITGLALTTLRPRIALLPQPPESHLSVPAKAGYPLKYSAPSPFSVLPETSHKLDEFGSLGREHSACWYAETEARCLALVRHRYGYRASAAWRGEPVAWPGICMQYASGQIPP